MRYEINRGDVVYFTYPQHVLAKAEHLEENQILRVVGLSGERIRIKKGQVYINGHRLDTFYGPDMNNNLQMLQKKRKEPDMLAYELVNINNLIAIVKSENREELLIPEGEVYLIGDNRWEDSMTIGPIPVTHTIGKVIGVAR